MHFHLEQLKADEGISQAISSAGRDQIGQPVSVLFRSSEAPVVPLEREPQPVPDKDDLVEATGNEESDVVSNVLDVLGGEIVGD
jgi:hypothetical protein